MPITWILSLVGGAMIGAAGALLFLAHGRIAGVSGITGALFDPLTLDRDWRIAFIGGLAAAGLAARFVAPSAIGGPVRSLPLVIVAGLLVGVGTRFANGCTSGHAVCGLGRLSRRSFVATLVFTATGMLTAIVARVAS